MIFFEKCGLQIEHVPTAPASITEQARQLRLPLYRYLPPRYTPAFLDRGEVQLRALSDFRVIECDRRRDNAEGIYGRELRLGQMSPALRAAIGAAHDQPVWVGESTLEFRSPDGYALCFSSRPCGQFRSRFRDPDSHKPADCIHIVDVPEFLARLQEAVHRSLAAPTEGIFGPVIYYLPSADYSQVDVPPVSPAHLKSFRFAAECEYRAFWLEPSAANRPRLILALGPLHDICQLLSPEDLKQASRATRVTHPVWDAEGPPTLWPINKLTVPRDQWHWRPSLPPGMPPEMREHMYRPMPTKWENLPNPFFEPERVLLGPEVPTSQTPQRSPTRGFKNRKRRSR